MNHPCLSIPSQELLPILQDVLLLAHDDDETSKQTIEKALVDNTKLLPTENATIQLNVIATAKTIVQQSEDIQNQNDLLTRLDRCLSRHAKLQFKVEKKPDIDETSLTKDQIKFRKRMERLKLAQLERSYSKLTSNLDLTDAPDQTIKSLMYATSVGLNMIVAPLSFGTFMYFFAGKIFGWVLGEESHDTSPTNSRGNVDMKGLIAGVVSGVIMLFIEMILFVIRNHEMDKAITKKAKSEKANPFGYVKSKAERNFNG